MRVNNLRAALKRALEASFIDEIGLEGEDLLKARLDALQEQVDLQRQCLLMLLDQLEDPKAKRDRLSKETPQ
jgi:hypothetical protein